MKPVFHGFRLKDHRGYARRTHLGQPGPEGEPQKVRRLQERAEGEGLQGARPNEA